MPRWRPVRPAWSPAATSTPFRTAVPSTARWEWPRRWRRWTCCARAGRVRGGRWGWSASSTRRVPGSGWPAPGRGCSPGRRMPPRVLALRDAAGTSYAQAMTAAGLDPRAAGPDPQLLRRVGAFVELHVEQGRGLVDLGAPVGVATAIRPHGRWRIDLAGRADHAGTTLLADRADPMLELARLLLAVREAAARADALATVGKVDVHPNAVNAIPSRVSAWLDVRADTAEQVRAVLAELAGHRLRRHAGVVDRGHAVRPAAVRPGRPRRRRARDRCGRAAVGPGAGHRSRPRRGHPGPRRDPRRDALRAQPHGRLARPATSVPNPPTAGRRDRAGAGARRPG